MVFRLSPYDTSFPPSHLADPSGLLAVGGDLSIPRLLEAYRNGIYPMYREMPILWWAPDPRGILYPQNLHISQSLRRTCRSSRFEVRVDTCFEEVIRQCASAGNRQYSNWLTEEMIQAYKILYNLGYAHSFETFHDGKLVGGLYGLSLGKAFFGESMFHTATDASKVALCILVEQCTLRGIRFIDTQQDSAHLRSLGATSIPHRRFITELKSALDNDNTLPPQHWKSNIVVLLLGGNIGNTHALILQAENLIETRIGQVVAQSHLYETEPWGMTASQNFLNIALAVQTTLSPTDVLHTTLEIETALGRSRQAVSPHDVERPRTYHSRTMDIDLIFYNSLVLNTHDLQLPHPRLHERRFVMQPLCDFMPHFLHPTLHKTMAEILQNCPDKGEITLLQ